MAEYRDVVVVDSHLMVAFSDITPVGIGHLSRTVHYAAHDGNRHVFEMGGALLDFFEGALEIDFSEITDYLNDLLGDAWYER